MLGWLAAARGGFVAVPLNPGSPGPELAGELAAVGARAVVVGPEGRHRRPGPGPVRAAGAGARHRPRRASPSWPATSPPAAVDREAADLAVLMFTSGTAGSPRAAMLTHGNLLANLEQVQASAGRRRGPDDVVFGVLPLFHIFGLNVVLGRRPDRRLDGRADGALRRRVRPRAVVEHGVTVLTGPPTMWAGLAAADGASPDAVATVELAASGAAALGPEIRNAVRERFGIALAEGYGLTEASPVVTSGVGIDAPVGSVGRPLPGVEVRLVDPTARTPRRRRRRDLGPGRQRLRRLLERPRGHHRRAHRRRLAAHRRHRLRRRGRLPVPVDRAKDLIIVSGFNVFPAEVEDVLVSHPAVGRPRWSASPHRTGEAVKAFVVLEAAASALEEDDLGSTPTATWPATSAPQKVEFVDELPQGPGGKVLRRSLRG